MTKKILIFVAIHFLAIMWHTNSRAENTQNVEDSAQRDHQQVPDHIDLKKLEEAYWSSKDDNYSVIQNRTFTKTNKFFVSANYGPLINDPYAKARMSGIRIGYFFNEEMGLEYSFSRFDSVQNDTVTAYETQFGGAKPDYNLPLSSQSLCALYTPFYAKMALSNRSIMYFDMGLTAGIGFSHYEVQKVNKDGAGNKTQANQALQSPHIEIGFVQQLFISRSLALRFDIKNTFYRQNTKQYEIAIGAPESSRTESSRNSNDTTMTAGITFFLQ